jgi:hypothetical protein
MTQVSEAPNEPPEWLPMGVVVLEPQPYRRMVRTLREFEGWRCLWRVPISAALFIAVPLSLIAATVGAAAVAGDDFYLHTGIVAAIISVIGSAYLHPRLMRRQLHRKVIANRLWTWEQPNPDTHVRILVRDPDVDRAKRALRQAGFNPGPFMTRLGTTPADAPELNVQVGVEEPATHAQSSSDEDRIQRMANALDAARIRARIAGIDLPRRSRAEPREDISR